MLVPITPDRYDDLHALWNRVLSADGIPAVKERSEVEDTITGPHDDPAANARLAVDGDDLVGFVHIHHRPPSDDAARVFVSGGVDAAHRRRGHGRRLMDWALARAGELLADASPDVPRRVRVSAYEFQDGARALFRDLGMEEVRWFYEMIRPLADLPEPAIPDGLEIAPWSDRHAAQVRLVHNEAFADHWDSLPVSEDSWAHMLGEYGTRLDLSRVALDGGEVVGYALNGHYPGDSEHTGRTEGWIEVLGTRASHRRSGVATALLAASMRAFANEGFDHAAIGVDAASPTGANRLYERVGFRVERTSVTSMLELPSG